MSDSERDPLASPDRPTEIAPAPAELREGAVLHGRYRLDGLLGRGGMGAVYLGFDAQLERKVAVKVLTVSGRPERQARFLQEARSAAALNHPHIVAVHDVGEERGIPFIVMELVPGKSLREAGALPAARVVEIGRQLAGALGHAHDHDIVHRDVKPENVLGVEPAADGPWTVKLGDLGVARSGRSSRLTEEGTIVGTATYIAPEQALGQPVDGRTDLYALGVVLYELLTGRPPFTGDDVLAVISQHLHAPVVPPRTYNAAIPAGLETVVLKLLAKEPDRRYASAAELDQALVSAEIAEVGIGGSAILIEGLIRGRLVGRAAELARLRDAWRRALEGEGRMVLLSGEPGAGKTRLARELAVQARLSGAAVLGGGCYEFEATTPYLPFVEAIRRWVHTAASEVLGTVAGETAPVLAKLAPELETRLGPFAPSPPLPPPEERLRLFDHAARFLESLSRERGLLLFLDDLHWADHGTLALLHYALRQLRTERVLVLATYREVELDRAHPLSAALVDWNRERLAERIPLGRLDRAGTAALLATLLGQETVTEEFARVVYGETEGNPFFIEEVLKTLIEQGEIRREEGSWQRGETGELAIPQSVKAVVGRRLDRIRPESAEVLQVAAALGRTFGFDELAAVGVQDEDRLLDALDEAVAAQLVAPVEGERFTFTHDKIREVLYEELNPIRRRRLHQKVGRGLERLRETGGEVAAQDLAHHFLEAGDLELGLLHAEAAAEAARAVYAHDEALAYYRQALECAEGLGRVTDEARLAEAMGTVQADIGDSLHAAESFARALEHVPEERRLDLRARIGEMYTRVGDPRGPDLLAELQKDLDRERHPALLGRTLAWLGRYHHYRGEHARSVELLTEAAALGEASGDSQFLGVAYTYLAGAYQHLAEYTQSGRWARRAIDLGESRGDLIAVALGHEFLAENCAGQGLWRVGMASAAKDEEIGRKVHALERVAWAKAGSGWNLMGLGELDRAETATREALELVVRIDEKRLQVLAESILARVLTYRGRGEEAFEVAESALIHGEEQGLLYLREDARHALAVAHLQAGNIEEALRLAGEAARLAAGAESRMFPMIFGHVHAQILVAAGRVDEAEPLIAEKLALARRAEAPHYEHLVIRARGQLHEARGEDAAALADYDTAAAGLELNESRVEHGRTLVLRGRLRRRMNDAPGAGEDLGRAREILAACGAEADVAGLDADAAR